MIFFCAVAWAVVDFEVKYAIYVFFKKCKFGFLATRKNRIFRMEFEQKQSKTSFNVKSNLPMSYQRKTQSFSGHSNCNFVYNYVCKINEHYLNTIIFSHIWISFTKLKAMSLKGDSIRIHGAWKRSMRVNGISPWGE